MGTSVVFVFSISFVFLFIYLVCVYLFASLIRFGFENYIGFTWQVEGLQE